PRSPDALTGRRGALPKARPLLTELPGPPKAPPGVPRGAADRPVRAGPLNPRLRQVRDDNVLT
ncbi:unnamed protein product, partial [Amoebophrya sp. A25]